MNTLLLRPIDCPYCGEIIDIQVDPSAGDQNYIEDCPVCCRPIEFRLEASLDGAITSLTARRDDD